MKLRLSTHIVVFFVIASIAVWMAPVIGLAAPSDLQQPVTVEVKPFDTVPPAGNTPAASPAPAGQTPSSGAVPNFAMPSFDTDPLVIRLKYIKGEQVKPLLTAMFPEVRQEYLNNMLIISGSEYDYDRVKSLLAQLDVPPRQVTFEAEIVEISRDDIKNIGINWDQTNPIALPTAPVIDGSAFRVSLGIPNHPEYGVNIKGSINKLIENKKGRLLASPRVAVLDGQTAQILIGDKLAVESRQPSSYSSEPIISVSYIDVGIKLEVTPTLNEDDTITTHLKPEVSNKSGETVNNNPNIRTRQAETTLRVKSGETIVLGGLIQREETRDTFKFPLLGDVPLVGHFFRSTNKEVKETELVILITPKMID